MTLEDIFKEEEQNNDIFDSFTAPEKKENTALEKTLEIETLDLNVYLDKTDKIEKPVESPKPDIKDIPKEKDHTIQESFINCSVLGFITAFMGTGWFINILNQI